MAQGLETRVPFLDNDLVDFAVGLPVALKVKLAPELNRQDENSIGKKKSLNYRSSVDSKSILRNASKKFLPDSTTQAKKQGFSAPDSSWFRGESLDFVASRLFERSASIYSVLDPDAVRGIVEDHTSGRRNRRLAIWSLLNVEEVLGSF
jgi:asparagine synthase (glutamine-hydrolysing)